MGLWIEDRPTAVIAAPVIWPDLILPTMLASGPAVPFQSHCTSTSPFVFSSTAFCQAENTLPHGLCFGSRVAKRTEDLASAVPVSPAVTNVAAKKAAVSFRIILFSCLLIELAYTRGRRLRRLASETDLAR